MNDNNLTESTNDSQITEDTKNKHTIFSRIDKYLTKLALYRVREILVEEGNKGYYRNPINIAEQIEIAREKGIGKNGFEYDTVKNIVYWSNGFYGVNSVNQFTLTRKKDK